MTFGAVAKRTKLQEFGLAIKAERLRRGMSQEELAERCGFDRTYISMLERGKRNPSLLNLLRLVKGLETLVSVLTEVYDGFDASE